MIGWWWFHDFAVAVVTVCAFTAVVLGIGIGAVQSVGDEVRPGAKRLFWVVLVLLTLSGAYVNVAKRAERQAGIPYTHTVEAP